MRGLQKWMTAALMAGILLIGDLHAANSKNHIEASMTEFTGVPHSSSLASAGESYAMSVDPGTAQGIFRRAATLTLTDFPLIDGKTVDLELERLRPVVDQTTKIHSGDRIFDIPEVISFYGTVDGDRNSRVVLNYAEGHLIGSVELSSGEKFSLSPALGQTKRANRDHVMQLSNGDNYDRHFDCGQEALPVPELPDGDMHADHDHAHNSKSSKDKLSFDDLLEVDLAVETDTYLYQTLVGLGEDEEFLINYTISLVAMISAIFQENINVALILTDINIYTDAAGGNVDPYNSARGQLGGILAEFSQYWALNQSGVRRDIAHIMSAYPAGGGVVGVAYTGNQYRGTLCRKNPFTGYGASGIRFNARTATLDYTGDVAVMAHELGHNFGAPHTHNCFWRSRLDGAVIDTCVNEASQSASDGCIDGPIQRADGTIMSYCHNVNSTRTVSMVFHPLMREQMRRNAENASSCVSEASSPVILVTRPYANENYKAGQTVDIRWTSQRVNSVVISYSVDGGENFDEIATVDANERTYAWATPFTDSENAIVRIADVRNENLYGESYASFTIESPSLTLQAPNGGEEVAAGSEFDIRWQGLLVDFVNVEYSLNNGDSWETIENDVSGSTYAWDVPNDAQTDEALVRVTASSNPELSDVSDGPFSIGSPTVTLLSPNGGEVWPLGGERKIRWESKFVRRARIEYSVNNGENWSVVSPFVTASDGEYSWTIPSNPDLASDVVRVRIRDLGADNVQSQSAAAFTLSINTSVKSAAELGFYASVQPNPAIDQAQLTVLADRSVMQFGARIVDLLGNTVLELDVQPSLPAGESRIAIDASTLAPGAYFILMQSDLGMMQQALNIVR